MNKGIFAKPFQMFHICRSLRDNNLLADEARAAKMCLLRSLSLSYKKKDHTMGIDKNSRGTKLQLEKGFLGQNRTQKGYPCLQCDDQDLKKHFFVARDCEECKDYN